MDCCLRGEKAKAVYDSDPVRANIPIMSHQKQLWFNNPQYFENVGMKNGFWEVSYKDYVKSVSESHKMFGLSDEERRINFNKADRFVLIRLIQSNI